MNVITIALLLLGAIGIIAAGLLFIASKRFFVKENPKVAEIEEILAGANCGACGFSGCHAFAVACAGATSLDGMSCTSLDAEGMKRIADITGLTPGVSVKKIAVIRCNASCGDNPALNHYEGIRSCALEASTYQGEIDCVYGCLGGGDCVAACPFDAMHFEEGSNFPSVDFDKCVGCGKCAAACPRNLIEIVPDKGDALTWVACMNTDRGAVAMKECSLSCIGCGKCVRACTHDAVKVTSFVAAIDTDKCVGCHECVEACPRHSIVTRNGNAVVETVADCGKEVTA